MIFLVKWKNLLKKNNPPTEHLLMSNYKFNPMKVVVLFAVFSTILVFSACKKPVEPTPKANLSITFRAVYESNPMVVFSNYATPNGDNIQFQTLNFMLSDLILVKTNGEEVLLKDIEYIDFSNTYDVEKATAGIVLTFNEIDTGTFKAIKFGVGVSPTLNATEPDAYETTSPLSQTGNYWNAWNSYIFSRVEGILDTLPAATGGNLSFFYHGGRDEMYQPRTFTKSFSLDENQTNALSFKIETKDIFYKTGAEMDIPAYSSSHANGAVGSTDFNVSLQILTNIADALSVQ